MVSGFEVDAVMGCCRKKSREYSQNSKELFRILCCVGIPTCKAAVEASLLPSRMCSKGFGCCRPFKRTQRLPPTAGVGWHVHYYPTKRCSGGALPAVAGRVCCPLLTFLISAPPCIAPISHRSTTAFHPPSLSDLAQAPRILATLRPLCLVPTCRPRRPFPHPPHPRPPPPVPPRDSKPGHGGLEG